MTEQKEQAFFESLLEQVQNITGDVRLNRTENGGTILTSVFSTVNDGSGICTFETELLQAFENEPQIEILVTMSFEVAGEDAFAELMEAVIQMNFYAPMGAFGFYYPSEQLYFRYTGFIDDEQAPKQMAAEVIGLYEKIAIVVGNVYGALERLATGTSDYETEAENGTLPQQE